MTPGFESETSRPEFFPISTQCSGGSVPAFFSDEYSSARNVGAVIPAYYAQAFMVA